MQMQDILDGVRVLPVLSIDDISRAVPLAQTLVDAGIKVMEVTLRTQSALHAIHAMTQACPDAVIGAGTVQHVGQLRRAVDAGARFAVSPGWDVELAEAAADKHLPFMPGVMTPSEVMQASASGCSILKLFPAKAAGGVEWLRSIAGPFPDIRFCPTGGIKETDVDAYLALVNVLCVGGSWVAPNAAVSKGDWHAVRRMAKLATL